MRRMSEAKKAEAMASKTGEFRSLFNMPDTETVIQTYRGNFNGTSGRIFVSQNYVCFYSSLPLRSEIVPFKKVDSIVESSGFLWSGVDFNLQDKTKHTVSSLLGQKDEFFNLVVYLWNNPPSYVSLPAEPKQIPGGGSPNPFGGGSSGSSPNMGGGRSFGGGGGQQQNPFGDPYQAQEQQVRVDTALARTALRTANEAKEMGTAMLQELQSQAEQIDRIEGNVERIHSRLNETNTLLRGIESLPAYIGNKFKKDKKQPPPIVDPPDRTIKVERSVKPMDIEILCKNKDDSFTPALLRLFKDSFQCIDPTSGRVLQPEYAWNYDFIDCVVMRARHEHMDIRFHPPRDRFRLMSSYLQVITNELVLRAPKDKIKVVFEPGVRTFAYKDPRISMQPTVSRATATTGFVRNDARQKASDLLSAGADPQLRKDLDETDNCIDEISDALSIMNDQALTARSEIVRQTEQLDRVNNRVDDANARIRQQNRRMEDIMRD